MDVNFSLDDRRRSLRQYVALGMDGSGDLYDLRVLREEIADDARPAGLIEPATPVGALGNPRTTVPQGAVQQQQTFAVVLYPRVEDEEDPRVHRLRADLHAQRLYDVISIGLVNDDDTELSRPGMVPLWDHADAATGGPARGNVPADPYAWMTVEDWTVQPIQDPLDDKRWSIVGSLRCSWWHPGRVAADEPIAVSMPGAYVQTTARQLPLASASGRGSGSLTLIVP